MKNTSACQKLGPQNNQPNLETSGKNNQGRDKT